MAERRVFQGIAEYCPPYMEADPCFVLRDPPSNDLRWFEGLNGQRVRLTVETIDEAAKERAAGRMTTKQEAAIRQHAAFLASVSFPQLSDGWPEGSWGRMLAHLREEQPALLHELDAERADHQQLVDAVKAIRTVVDANDPRGFLLADVLAAVNRAMDVACGVTRL